MELFSSYILAGLFSSTCATILCQTCIPLHLQTAPAIGIDLSMDYASASVKLYNGTFIDVARINGSSAYLSTMRRLYEGSRSQNDSFLSHLPTYVPSPEAQLLLPSMFDQATRVAREWMPFFRLPEPTTGPTTAHITDPNVVALSSILVDLRFAIEERLSTPLASPRIVLSVPDSLSYSSPHYRSLLNLAIEASQLSLAGERFIKLATAVALEHHGIPFYCDTDDPLFPVTSIHCDVSSEEKVDTALSLTYTAGGLSTVSMHRPYGFITASSAKEYDSLGAESESRHKTPTEYWRETKAAIEMTVADLGTVDHLEILGTHGNDGEFRDLVRDILESRDSGKTIKRSLNRIGGEDVAFTAARGAAGIARDVFCGLYDGCEYSQYCKEREESP